ncbi:MAG TPA: hypothetical protein VN039_09410 [Nitrospira sp.]|nr:hypothetical protein [Nitrospira sp.]
MSECVVKRHGDVVDGPMDVWEARDRAIELNERYQTDEYRVEEFDA